MRCCSCPGRPDLLKKMPIGMYHCGWCGAMVIAGLPHPSDESVREGGSTPYIDQLKEEGLV